MPITIAIDRRQPLARLLCRGDIVALTLHADGRLEIERRGAWVKAEIESSTTIYTRLVILRMRINDRIESLVLPRTATGDDALRRLRVWLKCKANALV
ncbi:MAG: hypothetical protein AB1443_12060 [Pseudomonadota bacterium]